MSILPTAGKWGLLFLLAWAFIWNLWAFALMGIDKGRAKKGKSRIPEKRLFGAAALGGALGALLGMRLFHHKTLHRSFMLGMPALLLFNLTVYVFLAHFLINA